MTDRGSVPGAADGAADERLLAELRTALSAADPVPDLVLETASAAFGTRRLDEELAELVADSALEVGADLVRGPARGTRWLAFETAGSGLELEVQEDGAVRHLLGQVLGGAAGPIELETGTGARSVPADDLGRFVVRGLPAGGLRLRYRAAGGPLVATSWVTI